MGTLGKMRRFGVLGFAAAFALVSVTAAAKTNIPENGRFFVEKKTTGAETITIQQPASGGRRVFLELANIYCAVAAVIELEKNGTAATATALTRNVIGPSDFSAVATAWSASDVGNGTTITWLRVPAGDAKSFDLEGLYMQGNGTGVNYTFRSDCTGDGEYYIRWREE